MSGFDSADDYFSHLLSRLSSLSCPSSLILTLNNQQLHTPSTQRYTTLLWIQQRKEQQGNTINELRASLLSLCSLLAVFSATENMSTREQLIDYGWEIFDRLLLYSLREEKHHLPCPCPHTYTYTYQQHTGKLLPAHILEQAETHTSMHTQTLSRGLPLWSLPASSTSSSSFSSSSSPHLSSPDSVITSVCREMSCLSADLSVFREWYEVHASAVIQQHNTQLRPEQALVLSSSSSSSSQLVSVLQQISEQQAEVIRVIADTQRISCRMKHLSTETMSTFCKRLSAICWSEAELDSLSADVQTLRARGNQWQ